MTTISLWERVEVQKVSNYNHCREFVLNIDDPYRFGPPHCGPLRVVDRQTFHWQQGHRSCNTCKQAGRTKFTDRLAFCLITPRHQNKMDKWDQWAVASESRSLPAGGKPQWPELLHASGTSFNRVVSKRTLLSFHWPRSAPHWSLSLIVCMYRSMVFMINVNTCCHAQPFHFHHCLPFVWYVSFFTPTLNMLYDAPTHKP